MKHSGKIKKAVMASVLAASMVVSMFNFGNVARRKTIRLTPMGRVILSKPRGENSSKAPAGTAQDNAAYKAI